MDIIWNILLVLSIIFCISITICTIVASLKRNEVIYRKRTEFMEQKYYDFTILKRNDYVYKNFHTKPWNDVDINS